MGPTAAGKTALALEVAERAGAEILSLDSMAVYRGLEAGTAKPSAAERARVRHHLIDVADPSETYDARRWLADARAALEDVCVRGARALFVGGTGFYLAVLLRGLFEGPPSDPELRARVEGRVAREGAATLHAELAGADPAAAARIHAHDTKRLVRALEVLEQTGRPLSEWQREWGGEPAERERRARLVGLELAPERLDERIRARTRAMLERGWREEALALRAAGRLGPGAAQALGYDVVLAWADGELGREEAEERIARATRRFARRQRTWWRKFDVRWLPAPEEGRVAERAQDVLAALGWA